MNVLHETLSSSTRERVVAAALECLAAQGLRRTTVDDVASRAGISRATLYRAFPGGRDTILGEVVESERARLLAAIADAINGATDLGGALCEGLGTAASWLSNHAVLVRLMFDEPAVVLTHVEFEQMDETLAAASAAVSPHLTRFLAPAAASRAGEWVVRILISYLLFPADGTDLTVPAEVVALVERHVLPGVLALAVDTS